MSKTKEKLLKGLTPGTPEYVLRHAEWRRSRGKKHASESLKNVDIVFIGDRRVQVKNPAVSLFLVHNYFKAVTKMQEDFLLNSSMSPNSL